MQIAFKKDGSFLIYTGCMLPEEAAQSHRPSLCYANEKLSGRPNVTVR